MLFFSIGEVLEIHKSQIRRFGGQAGIRDLHALHSAIGMPFATFDGAFLHADAFDMAAAYLYHIARGHPFVDGNKRTAAATAIAFLKINGIETSVPADALVELDHAIVRGDQDKTDAAHCFRAHSQPNG